MSSITGGDTLQSLLNIIADPKSFQARLDEQNAATKTADEAVAKMAATQELLKSEKAALKAERTALDSDIAAFAAEKKTIQDQVKTFTDREKYLSDGEIKLANEKSEFLANTTAKATELDSREAAVRKAEADVNSRITALQSSQSNLAATQAELDQKLAAIRALAK